MRYFLILLFLTCPVFLPPASAESSSLRISRPEAASEGNFHSLNEGISIRWWRKFKNPAFCPYVLCGGSCAEISGTPKIGSYSHEQLISDETPCSLEQRSLKAPDDDCCMSKSVSRPESDSCHPEKQTQSFLIPSDPSCGAK
ncbi:MAG: hypothetical protein K2X27_17680 [Candidatus Obscuribacterales bacterium]|nr:hypothetical protein [Candidatus Obscuribacterales bacterium]